MSIDQNTLNKMAETLIKTMNHVLEYHNIGIDGFQLTMADGTIREVSFNETLELCLLGLAEKLDLAEEE